MKLQAAGTLPVAGMVVVEILLCKQVVAAAAVLVVLRLSSLEFRGARREIVVDKLDLWVLGRIGEIAAPSASAGQRGTVELVVVVAGRLWSQSSIVGARQRTEGALSESALWVVALSAF